MIFYSEEQYNEKLKKEVDQLLGEPVTIREQIMFGAVGSSVYRLKRAKINDKISDSTDLNIRCNFQKFKKGFLLRMNHNMNLSYIAISYSSIDKIELLRAKKDGEPDIVEFTMLKQIFTFLTYPRYFWIPMLRKNPGPLVLRIFSGQDILELDTNRLNYRPEKKYFRSIKKLKGE
ncbi:hypothetical protein ACE1ET_14075 [Saccharicrinis sp. FJH62]|uniref:hypothetical protein n=1 Tax=Saccharicrinis sp. FJH62 TaxID=3344657 RepID=UPI0035D4E233